LGNGLANETIVHFHGFYRTFASAQNPQINFVSIHPLGLIIGISVMMVRERSQFDTKTIYKAGKEFSTAS
jgi:hypothetical protein